MRVENSQGASGRLVRRLTLFDSVMVVVGGTIGAAIFITPADVLRAVPDARIALLLWVIAGGITLMAGLACAELGGMYPEAGGQYVFIREAFGRFAAFIYGWVLFTAGNSGALAAMAIAFAIFFGHAFPAFSADHVLLSHTWFGIHWELNRGAVVAALLVIVLTGINLRSVKLAAWLQNVTASGFLLAIVAIVVLGLLFGHGSWSNLHSEPGNGLAAVSFKGLGIAMIALLWTFDGWEFLSWVAGEIENPRRNLPLALILGIVLIIVTYLLANIAFLYALPREILIAQTSLADATIDALFSRHAGRWVSLFVAFISLGSASVVVLGGARIYLSMAQDGIFFRSMAHVQPRWNTPIGSLLAQCVWVLVLIMSGRYEQLYTCFIFMMTLTYVFTVGALFVLRRTQPDRPRPYHCPGYPWLPILYLMIASSFVVSTLLSKPVESAAGLAMAATGVPMYFFWRWQDARIVGRQVDQRG
jgi:basic amino acid/polyamine antiporter, APA family